MSDESSQTPISTVAGQRDPSRLPHGEENLSPLAQLKRMQRVLFERTQEDETDDKVIAAIACAWERLEGRKAILCMKPAPKPIDVSDRQPRKRRSSAGSATPTDGPLEPPA